MIKYFEFLLFFLNCKKIYFKNIEQKFCTKSNDKFSNMWMMFTLDILRLFTKILLFDCFTRLYFLAKDLLSIFMNLSHRISLRRKEKICKQIYGYKTIVYNFEMTLRLNSLKRFVLTIFCDQKNFSSFLLSLEISLEARILIRIDNF